MNVFKYLLVVVVVCLAGAVSYFYFNRNISVSVIVPVYNTEQYLDECLSSLENQTLKDMEFIVIDDGSTDNSFKIMQKYAKKDNRFKIYTKQNEGVGKTRNMGLSLAKGQYIGFVDSDDYVSKNYFEGLYNVAKKYDAEVSVASNVFYVRDGNKEKIERIIYKVGNKEYIEDFSFFISDAGEQWDKIYKKSFLDKYDIRSYEERLWYEDLWFSLLVGVYASKVAIDRNGEYFRRIRDESLSAYWDASEKYLWHGLDMFKKLYEHLNVINVSQDKKYDIAVKLREKIYWFLGVFWEIYNGNESIKNKVQIYFMDYEAFTRKNLL